MDGRSNRRNKAAFSNLSRVVWTELREEDNSPCLTSVAYTTTQRTEK